LLAGKVYTQPPLDYWHRQELSVALAPAATVSGLILKEI